MKRFTMIILLSLVSTTGALAQISAGTFTITGNGYYKTNKGKLTHEDEYYFSLSRSNYRELQINPTIGYFISENFEVGVSGSVFLYRNLDRWNYSTVDSMSNRYSNEGKHTSYRFLVGPYLRKYFFITERLALTATSIFSYNQTSGRSTSKFTNWNGVEDKNSYNGPKTNSLSLHLGAGIIYFVTDKIGVNAGLGGIYYSRSSSKENRTTNEGIPYVRKVKGNSGGLDFSPQYVNLGLSYYFGGN